MAVLTSTGIQFSDSSTLTSKYGIVPQGSVAVFYQSAAPTGWTKVTTHNDKALRVVSGTGGGSGGVNAFSSTFPSDAVVTTSGGAIGNTTLTLSQIPSHAHSALTYNAPAPQQGGPLPNNQAQGGSTGSAGGDGSHNHPFTNSTIDLRVQYIDCIICSLN
jgi:hypothetical protein